MPKAIAADKQIYLLKETISIGVTFSLVFIIYNLTSYNNWSVLFPEIGLGWAGLITYT